MRTLFKMLCLLSITVWIFGHIFIYLSSYEFDLSTPELDPSIHHINNDKHNIQCPLYYKTCTNQIEDIFNYVELHQDKEEQCIYMDSRQWKNYIYNISSIYNKSLTLIIHSQGDFLTFNKKTNISLSKAFDVHRVYLNTTSRKQYRPLMNTMGLCNHWIFVHINKSHQVNSTYLNDFQCNIHLQNTSVISNHLSIDNNDVSMWYGDNDNYIDIITSRNVFLSRSGDVYNPCYNEQFVGRERCGTAGGVKQEELKEIKFNDIDIFAGIAGVFNYKHQNKVQTVNYSILIAQSIGYYHWIIESFPRISPFINILSNVRSKYYKKWLIKTAQNNQYIAQYFGYLNIFVNYNKSINEEENKYHNGYSYVYTKNVIIPQPSPCTYSRKYISILLSDYLRKMTKEYIKRFGIVLPHKKEKHSKNILLLKRDVEGRRFIMNWNEIKSMIINEFSQHNLLTFEYEFQTRHLNVYGDSILNTLHKYLNFYIADIVIGAFGAGLTNVIWCKPGTALILIVKKLEKSHRMFMYQSTMLGMKYYAYSSSIEGRDHNVWNVSVQELKQVIQLYL